jgi:hypothetical protein
VTSSGPGLSNLPPGTTLLTPNASLQGLQGFALVPAQYVTQVMRLLGFWMCIQVCYSGMGIGHGFPRKWK